MEKIKQFWANMSPREKIILGVVVVAVIGYALWRRNQANTQAATGTTQTATDQFGQAMLPTDPGTFTSNAPGTLPPGPAPGTQPPTTTGTTGPVLPCRTVGGCIKPPPKMPPVKPPTTGPQYVTVVKWTPTNTPWNSTLSGIAAHEHESLSQLEKLNPQITNPNYLYVGERIRVA